MPCMLMQLLVESSVCQMVSLPAIEALIRCRAGAQMLIKYSTCVHFHVHCLRPATTTAASHAFILFFVGV